MNKEYTYKQLIKLGEGSYIGSISALDIVKLWEDKVLTYVPDAQRGTRKERELGTGKMVEVPIHYKKNIREIKDAIMSGDYFTDTISINIIKDDESIARFNQGELYAKGTHALLDGYHRVIALCELSKTREGVKAISYLEFPVKVTTCDIDTAKRQFYQFTLGSKISASRAAYLNNKNYSARITNRLLEDGDSVLQGRILTTSNSVTSTDRENVVTFGTLTQAIDISFDTKAIVNEVEYEDIVRHLKKFFKFLFEVIPEFNDFDERKALRTDNNIMCDNIMFYGYTHIAAHIPIGSMTLNAIKPLRKISYYKDSEWLKDNVRISTKEIEKPNGSIATKTRYTVLNGKSTRRALCVNLLLEYKKLTYSKGI